MRAALLASLLAFGCAGGQASTLPAKAPPCAVYEDGRCIDDIVGPYDPIRDAGWSVSILEGSGSRVLEPCPSYIECRDFVDASNRARQETGLPAVYLVTRDAP